MSSNKYQPALLGGLFIGILSSLPIIGNSMSAAVFGSSSAAC